MVLQEGEGGALSAVETMEHALTLTLGGPAIGVCVGAATSYVRTGVFVCVFVFYYVCACCSMSRSKAIDAKSKESMCVCVHVHSTYMAHLCLCPPFPPLTQPPDRPPAPIHLSPLTHFISPTTRCWGSSSTTPPPVSAMDGWMDIVHVYRYCICVCILYVAASGKRDGWMDGWMCAGVWVRVYIFCIYIYVCVCVCPCVRASVRPCVPSLRTSPTTPLAPPPFTHNTHTNTHTHAEITATVLCGYGAYLLAEVAEASGVLSMVHTCPMVICGCWSLSTSPLSS